MRAVRFLVRYVCAVLACLYLFTFGFLVARHRRFIAQICSHFGLSPKPGLPSVKLSELIPLDDSIRLAELQVGDGNTTLYELTILALLARVFAPSVIFEIGTFDGRTTLNLALNAPPSARIYTLDLPKAAVPAGRAEETALTVAQGDETYIQQQVTGRRFRSKSPTQVPEVANIHQLEGDSATFDFRPYHDGVDMLFIDGAHSYEYVQSDTRNAMKMLRGGKGVIVWHDYESWEGVTRALDELRQQNPRHHYVQIEGTHMACLILR